jgi:metal-sulfur cluster biosynthetic enzyme
LLNEISDPCSVAAQTPVGLWDMGLVTHLDVRDDAITLRLRPTFPGCLFIGHLYEQARERLAALAWCSSVELEVDSSTIWTEEDMAPRARQRLEEQRGRARAAMSNGRW